MQSVYPKRDRILRVKGNMEKSHQREGNMKFVRSQLTFTRRAFNLTGSSTLRALFERPLSWLLRSRLESVRAIPSIVEIYGCVITPVSSLDILRLIQHGSEVLDCRSIPLPCWCLCRMVASRLRIL